MMLGEDAMLQRVNSASRPRRSASSTTAPASRDVGPELSEDDNTDTVSIRVVRRESACC